MKLRVAVDEMSAVNVRAWNAFRSKNSRSRRRDDRTSGHVIESSGNSFASLAAPQLF